jgi:hypothetical protein
MTSWAEEIARNHVRTREGRPEAESRPAWATEGSDEFPPVTVRAAGRARVDGDAHFSLVGRAGTLTPLQRARVNGTDA